MPILKSKVVIVPLFRRNMCGERKRRNVKIRIHYPWKMKGVRLKHEIHERTVYTKQINSIDLNDRLARTLHDNNHEVINSGNRFCVFFFFFSFSFFFFLLPAPLSVIDWNEKKIPGAVSVLLTINRVIIHK